MLSRSVGFLRVFPAVMAVLALGAVVMAPAHAGAVLSSGYVTPASGSSSTDFTYRVKYWNTDNIAPNKVWVAVWWSSSGRAYWYEMVPLTPSDTNYTDGAWYTARMRGLDDSAHFFRFTAQVGAAYVYLPAPAGSYQPGPTVANVTILSSGYVAPTSGSSSTVFTFRVKYWDTANRAPDTRPDGKPQMYVVIWWGSQGRGYWYPMAKLDPLDYNYTDGCWFTLSQRGLDDSPHAYRFAVQTKGVWTYLPLPAGSYANGPDVDNKPRAPWPVIGGCPDSDHPDHIFIGGWLPAGATACHLYSSSDGLTWNPVSVTINYDPPGWVVRLSGVQDGTHFRVTASNSFGEGAPSEQVVAWPSRIQGGIGLIVTVPKSGNSGVSRTPQISWSSVAGAGLYTVVVLPLIWNPSGHYEPGADVYDALVDTTIGTVKLGQTSGPGIVWAAGVSLLQPLSHYRLLVSAYHESDNFEFASSGDQDFVTGP